MLVRNELVYALILLLLQCVLQLIHALEIDELVVVYCFDLLHKTQ